MIEYLNDIADGWFAWQFDMLWQVSLLIVIVYIIDLLIRRWTWPQVRYAMWMLVFVKLLLPTGLSSPISLMSLLPSIDYSTQNAEYAHTVSEIEIAGSEILNQVQDDTIGTQFNRMTRGSAHPTVSGWLFIVWLIGTAALAVWLIVRLTSLRQEHLKTENHYKLPERFYDIFNETAEKLNLKKLPRVILTDKVKCPAVFGLFRPVLLMPANRLGNLTRKDMEHILLHELAHIKRGDLFVHAVCMCLQTAYWYNPLLWIIRRPVQNLRELCCDASVAQILTDKTYSYRQTLLETARQLLAEPVEPGLGLLGLFENSSWLAERLKWLEKNTWRRRPLRIATILILVCVMLFCVIPMAKAGNAEFVIRGTVVDASTGKPIAGARVGDNKYNYGKFFALTDSDGNYSYKTYYEEHNITAEANGYNSDDAILLTKLFGPEKERVMDFALEKQKKAPDLLCRKAL